uniref:dynein regulatory complex subunit 5-like n=1 Tax=Ciona intestinalis TaxID=7719 RepID=UPI000180CD96|nr:dynein regulatory complex subunit 5-like [Ciona intestinalis]|eukprot:XP_002132102.1 dynein regulatory complex subunit 5-like [Ciona intestinalis]
MVVSDLRFNVVKPSAGATGTGSNLDPKKMRRIIAEDPDWSLNIVPLLKDLALNHIINNFSNNPILKGLHPKDKIKVLDRIDTKIPLTVTSHLVEDEGYWKRCCKAKWAVCDVSIYDGSWKQMFFERHLEELIENFVPGKTEDEVVDAAIPLCSKYVKQLNIRQLLPPVSDSPKSDENISDLGSDAGSEAPSMDHFEFGTLLEKLPHLEKFKVSYGVRDCGMNFEWSLFHFTQRDCLLLAKSIKSCKHLKKLCIYKSKVDDEKVRVLISHLLDHPNLTEIDFSHNCIGDRGARAIGKLINNRCPKLRKVDVYDNIIRSEGAKAIAFALTKNSTLQSLNLRLNRLGDEGGQVLCKALLKNNTLKELNVASNELTEPTAAILSQVLQSNTSLTSMNLSGNRIGVDGGKQLQEGMESNKTIVELDLRLTEAGQESEYCINLVLKTNQDNAREAEEAQSKK